MENIYDRVVEFIKFYSLEDKTIIVGFSGGYDSMCLLDLLTKIRDNEKFYDMTIVAAHFNHNWRGEESLREQEVCRIFASSKGVEFYCKDAPHNLKKTENDARIARYDFFEEVYENFDADAVFTAHNKDDNAETVLYRIIKGTGIVGLKGISEKRGFFYRPLLKTTRKEIVDYCNRNNLAPNNDSSNSDTNYRRNYLRLNVIPALEKINEGVKDALNTLSYNSISDNEIIEEYLSGIRCNIFQEDKILAQEYAKLSTPVKKRILHEYLQSLDLDYDYKKINEIYDFIEKNITQRNGSTHSLATALWLYADDKIIEPIPSRGKCNNLDEKVRQEILVSTSGEYEISDKTLVLKPYVENDLFVFPESTSNFAYVDFSMIQFPLVLRHRKDGDVITPFGMTGSMKLKKYMNAKGVSRHNRDDIFLLCKDNEVLWAVGIGISNKVRVKNKPTHVIEIV